VPAEGFAQVVVLGEDDLCRVQVEILSISSHRGTAATS
jgi:hypothetical protein